MRVDGAGRSVAARTMTAEARPVRTVVRGYGNVQAARSWAAVSEIAGTIVWRHPDLETGNMLPKGTTALRIDPSAYQLAVASRGGSVHAAGGCGADRHRRGEYPPAAGP